MSNVDALKLMLIGGTAGAVSKTCVAPLERTKLLMQVQGMRSERQTPAEPGRRSIRRTMRWVMQTQGFRAFWRGNGANLVRIVPNKAVLFFCNDFYKETYRNMNAFDGPIPKHVNFAIGATSGATVAISTYPLDFIRTRLCAQEGATNLRYSGIIDCAIKTVRNEGGVLSLYAGIRPTLVGIMPYAGLTLMCYESFKAIAPSDENGRTPVLYKLCSGAAAGCIAQTAVFPMDTIRRRMVLQGETKALYSSSIDCARTIFRNEGWNGFYHGAFANVFRAIPNTAIQWTVMEELKTYFGI